MIPEVTEDFVLTKCQFFTSTQVWPLKTKLDPDGWLANFDANDKSMATQLLNSFMYFSDDVIDRMFVSAVQGLSREVTTIHAPLSQRRSEWSCFLDETVFTFPTGENPFVGDSGHLFVRRARDLLGLDEAQVLSPDYALEKIGRGSAKGVVFVDDFVGTGQQFLKTWRRRYSRTSDSFETLASRMSFSAFYCPLFCTTYATSNQLNPITNRVTLSPSHWLTREHCLFTSDSIWWPDAMKPHVHAFIRDYSMRIGLPDTNGNEVRDWQAYNKLGLAVAFRHCCPDATIPLFDTTENGWCPLWKR